MIFESPPELDAKRLAINALYRADEARVVRRLLRAARLGPEQRKKVRRRARGLVKSVRAARLDSGGIDAFLQEYELSSDEGVVLMCLAEALLRIPDAETADRLIRDKIGGADWKRHIGASESLFVNASTWALMLTGRLLGPSESEKNDIGAVFTRMIARGGEPVIRQAMTQAMRILGRQFVMGRTIDEALDRARSERANGYRHSFDMLGEAARTAADAERYFEAYASAIATIGTEVDTRDPIDQPGISVKLSALHPRYEYAQRERVLAELTPRLIELAAIAKDAGIGLTVDAEEADRLDLSLDVFDQVSAAPHLADWDGLGIAVQAYQKRAMPWIDWLAGIARRDRRRLMVRLVKGAYWDSEIKRGQERGLEGYPVFTRKAATDVAYIACARRLLDDPKAFYPQFATHNALTLATVEALAGKSRPFEYQRLHGMGEALYGEIVGPGPDAPKCRVYAPVGSHEDLLPYLVRRLLENGANTSFVNRIVDEDLPIALIVADPVEIMTKTKPIPHPSIPLPVAMFGEERPNSAGIDLSDPVALRELAEDMEAATEQEWIAAPGAPAGGAAEPGRPLSDPSDRRQVVGVVHEANSEQVGRAVTAAVSAFDDWTRRPAPERAACLERAAYLFDEHRASLMAIAVREAGKTIPDALGEVREAIDFLRYYAMQARSEFASAEVMPGPTGERNELMLHGRGAFACISPWNFPLAIFTGQLAAALAAGNTVVAKPAEQTPLIAAQAAGLLHLAGVPEDVLIVLPGDGPSVGAPLVADPRIAGVAFTGSTETARAINRTLAERDGPIVPLIAETGGQNALIVDSSALAEQVVEDVLASAFNSAGQRCSALRVLFLQEEIADRTIEMLTGAMSELRVGDPSLLATDIGPVIDDAARAMLEAHTQRMDREARLIKKVDLPDGLEHGTFFAPCAYEIDGLDRLEREVFGPVLHVIRYRADKLDAVIDAVNATGYGLTLGIHSRIDATVRTVHARAKVGNAYVNRNMIGAIVGSQPFGGEGLSGTGPKAGGPRYLHRFAVERSLSVDTTAAGGNAALMTLEDN
ncbi:MAG: bifunctional proline dehydrogenase/L-glutamate gamma-semialdehyde dehydrogenase PutA [Alphaproteobacteria bacterium]|nr:bifunctional proline dehydrogenase/L-glutamate gamma-semialdehyde dehydrogenase PutA [Alphaproteobacteria bacterium]